MFKETISCALFSMLLCAMCMAQSSTNYTIEQSTINNGGHPLQGQVLASPNYSITLDAVGDGLIDGTLSSLSFELESGLTSTYRPPEEVINLKFSDKTHLIWDPESTLGLYNLYRGNLGDFSTYGTCLQPGLTGETAEDAFLPASGQGIYYMVTAINRLDEEGAKGFDSSTTQRDNTNPCP